MEIQGGLGQRTGNLPQQQHQANPEHVQSSISISELNTIIKNSENFYWIVFQNGFFLPKYNPNVTTAKYLQSILEKKFYTPMLSEI